jgi:2-polyprenyl-3-methyl-5-hydroxy-6-metoxy-1,4-benzoquinol methylase
MKDRFEKIRSMYQSGYKEHGDSPAALLTPKGRNNLRFRALLPLIDKPGLSVLDYGCGLGYLFDYLQEQGVSVCYTGMDMMPEFIDTCRQKYGDKAEFELIEAEQPLTRRFDLVFASGVFNIRTHADDGLSRVYATARLKQLLDVADLAMVCDFLSPYVDFKQGDSQHFDTGYLADFCARELSRRFILRHDLLPYEFTLIVWRDDQILRPENFFEVDA